MAKFSLSWDAHKQNICSGLSVLQQNGEFVDMTIAADGHHVKVHQMIMSLASPYIKDIIKSLECSHPVIFLNKISYPTLCAILEYIYTGEVLVDKDNLTELIDAAKELHIMGLYNLKMELSTPELVSQAIRAKSNKGQSLSEAFVAKTPKEDNFVNVEYINNDDDFACDSDDVNMLNSGMDLNKDVKPTQENKNVTDTRIQYTISNQGCLQMVLNRFVYYLRYTSRRGAGGRGHRQWRCIDSAKPGSRCPAKVITRDDVVVQRLAAHNHPFHDKQILKKVRDQAIYTAITEAEAHGNNLKLQRHKSGKTEQDDGNQSLDT